jgi:hypothetical protein
MRHIITVYRHIFYPHNIASDVARIIHVENNVDKRKNPEEHGNHMNKTQKLNCIDRTQAKSWFQLERRYLMIHFHCVVFVALPPELNHLPFRLEHFSVKDFWEKKPPDKFTPRR